MWAAPRNTTPAERRRRAIEQQAQDERRARFGTITQANIAEAARWYQRRIRELEAGAWDCPACSNGHVEDCDALEPAHDIGDLIARTPCDGCCPFGCRPAGLQALQDSAAAQAQAVLQRPLPQSRGRDDEA